MRIAKVLVLECIPKNDRMSEGAMLADFLNIVGWRWSTSIANIRIASKSELISMLGGNDIRSYDLVHISSHGDDWAASIKLPKGRMNIPDLPEGCFKGMTVCLSACSMGRKDFAAPFIERTEAETLIGPREEIPFEDAAIWFANFYYLVIRHGYSPQSAYARCNRMLAGKIVGGMKLFSRPSVVTAQL